MSPKWVVVVGLLALAAIFGGGYGVGYGLRAAQDAKVVASAQGSFDLCKTTNGTQADALSKIRTQLADEKTKAEKLQSQAAELLKSRDGLMQKIEQRGRGAAAGIREQGHEDADSAALARLPVPPAVAWRLWPGTAASAGAPANH